MMEPLRPVTIREVARQAGVSPATVSNVLNTPSIVASETRARVAEAIEQLGFVRNHSARQLRSGTSVAIGLVVIAIDDFFAELARGVEEAANEAGCLVILCNSAGDASKEERYVRLLAEQRVRGVLIAPLRNDAAHLRRLERWRMPNVRLVGTATGSSGHSEVGGDFARDAELAIEHLLSIGHRRIGFINGPLEIEACLQRRTGALRALAFRTRFVLPAAESGQPVSIVIGGLDDEDWSGYSVYLNGRALDAWKGAGRWREPHPSRLRAPTDRPGGPAPQRRDDRPDTRLPQALQLHPRRLPTPSQPELPDPADPKKTTKPATNHQQAHPHARRNQAGGQSRYIPYTNKVVACTGLSK